MSNDPILQAHMAKRAQEQADRLSRNLRKLAKKIDTTLDELTLPGDERPVFGLFVFTGGAAQYVGNGERADIKMVVASVLRRWDDPNYNSLHKPWHDKTDEEKAAEGNDPL